MKPILNRQICTFYKSVIDFQPDKKHLTTPGVNKPILDILTNERYTNTDLLNKLRLSGYKSEFYTKNKNRLSAATFSTVQDDLTITRSDSNVNFRTGFITVDIDADKNPSMEHPGGTDEIKDVIIETVPFISYLGRSVSNIGLWALIPISYPDDHQAHFRALIKYFNNIGIYIDTPLLDVSRLRFIAYDPDAHIELNAEVFTDTIESKDEVLSNFYERKDVNEDSDEFFIAACKWIEMKHNLKFEPGYIHNYLLRLYATLRYAHVNRQVILNWIYKNLISEDKVTTNCLDEIEVKK